jgi:hypothetical protein
MRKRIEINPYSYITTSWINPILKAGYKRPLQEDDLMTLEKQNQAKTISDSFAPFWSQHEAANGSNGEKPKFFWHLVKVVFSALIGNGIALFVEALCSIFLVPTFIGQAVLYFDGNTSRLYFNNIAVIAAFLIGGQLLVIVFQSMVETTNRRIELLVTSAVVTAVYEKSFRLSNQAMIEFPVGKIMTLIGSDARQLTAGFLIINMLWMIPLKLIGAIVFLYFQIGISGLASLILAGVTLLIPTMTASFMRKYYRLYLV